MKGTRVICSIENASTCIDGIAFATVAAGDRTFHVSERIEDPTQVQRFLNIGCREFAGEVPEDEIEAALNRVRATAVASSPGTSRDKETIVELTAANKAMASDLSAQRRENEALKAGGASTETAAKLAALESEKATLAQEKATLQAENGTLTQENAALKGANDAIARDNESLRAANDSATGQVATLRTENDRLTKANAELTDRGAALEAKAKATGDGAAAAPTEGDGAKKPQGTKAAK